MQRNCFAFKYICKNKTKYLQKNLVIFFAMNYNTDIQKKTALS